MSFIGGFVGATTPLAFPLGAFFISAPGESPPPTHASCVLAWGRPPAPPISSGPPAEYFSGGKEACPGASAAPAAVAGPGFKNTRGAPFAGQEWGGLPPRHSGADNADVGRRVAR